MQELTQQEFYQLMLDDLQQDYLMGLHNISLKHYIYHVLENNDKEQIEFSVPDYPNNNVSYENIIQNIFKNGLNVPKSCAGHTVSSAYGTWTLENLNAEFFYYDYYDTEIPGPVHNVIVAIPAYWQIDGEKYFIGGLFQNDLLASLILKKNITTEFIYGCFIRHGLGYKKPSTFELLKNKKHISFLSKEEQSEFYKQVLDKNNISMNMLEIINNSKPIGEEIDFLTRSMIESSIERKEEYERSILRRVKKMND